MKEHFRRPSPELIRSIAENMKDELEIIGMYQIAEKTGWTFDQIRDLSYAEYETIRRYTKVIADVEKEKINESKRRT